MKQTILLTIFSILAQTAMACDVCGCVLSHNILPSDTRTFIGVNYRISQFVGSHTEGTLPAEFYRENYQFMDLSAKYSLKNRWEFIAVIPMGQFAQYTDATSQNNREGVLSDKIKGLGDVNLTTRYALINKTGLDNHRLSVGATLELPTGKYDQKSKDEVIYHSRQMGSGSVNAVLALSYGFKRQTWGFQTQSSIKLNGENALGYRQGNSFNATLEFFYKKRIKDKFDLIPRLGSSFETAERNRLNGINYDLNTARSFALGNVALDVYFKKVFVSIAFQKPFSQTLELGQLENKGRILTSVNYLF